MGPAQYSRTYWMRLLHPWRCSSHLEQLGGPTWGPVECWHYPLPWQWWCTCLLVPNMASLYHHDLWYHGGNTLGHYLYSPWKQTQFQGVQRHDNGCDSQHKGWQPLQYQHHFSLLPSQAFICFSTIFACLVCLFSIASSCTFDQMDTSVLSSSSTS